MQEISWQVPTRINLVQTKHSWHQTQSSGCGAGRGARSRRRGRPPADGVIQSCAARDTRRLVPPGLFHKAGIVTLAGAVLAG